MKILDCFKVLSMVIIVAIGGVFANENTLLILQVGAATDGNVSHSFVELYNNGEQAVNLSGYSLQYAEGTRESNAANRPNLATEDGEWNKIDLSGTIQPKHSFLILGKKGENANPALLITDDYGDINDGDFEVSNRSFKVVLLSNTDLLTVQNPFDIDGAGTKATGYVDMVGAMNTVGEDKINGYEQNPITDLNKQTGQRRKTLIDTDDNAYDFERAVYVGANLDDFEFRRPKNHDYGEWNPVKTVLPPSVLPTNGLPIIIIDTKGGAPILDKENYVNMTFTLIDPNNSQYNVVIENNVDGIRGRGNSTWWDPVMRKKPYRIKFDNKQSLLGLPAAKSWVLLAEFGDHTLLMNAAAFKLGDIFNLPYNHKFQHIELYLNGEYMGVYVLTEQNQVGEGRVDIDENESWLVEFDSYYDEDPKFRTTRYNLPVMIKSPEFSTDVNDPRYDFVRNDINELCDSLASANFPENGYRDLIDINTFVDFLMINEIVMNGDIEWPNSTYLYRDKYGKISMGPLWDFSYGYGRYDPSNLWYYENYTRRIIIHQFFNRFFQDPIFLAKYKERWNEKYQETVVVSDIINDYGTQLAGAATQNANKWYPSYNPYAKWIEIMKEWWNNRCLWLNTELNKVEILPKTKTFAEQTFGYTEEISPQKFTLVSFGDMENLSATFKKSNLSDFEISTQLNKTSTGNGGYLATISVKPKSSLVLAATYTDALVLSGTNQGKAFSIEVPLTFVVQDEGVNSR